MRKEVKNGEGRRRHAWCVATLEMNKEEWDGKNYTLSGSEEKDGEFHATHLSKVKRKFYKYYSRKPHKHMPT